MTGMVSRLSSARGGYIPASFVMMIVPLAANMPPTPWQTEIFAPGICAGAMPRIWRTRKPLRKVAFADRWGEAWVE